jgi:hypothetical protein
MRGQQKAMTEGTKIEDDMAGFALPHSVRFIHYNSKQQHSCFGKSNLTGDKLVIQ